MRLVQYSDHADLMTLRPSRGLPLSPNNRFAPERGCDAEIYRENIRSHKTRLNARRVERKRETEKESKLQRCGASKVRSRVMARRHDGEARPASHRDRSAGGRVYSEKGSARERGEEQQIGWQVLIGALHLARRTN